MLVISVWVYVSEGTSGDVINGKAGLPAGSDSYFQYALILLFIFQKTHFSCMFFRMEMQMVAWSYNET